MLLAGIIALWGVVGWASGDWSVGDLFRWPPRTEPVHTAPADTRTLTPNGFQQVREINILGTRCIELQHTPTSQRVLLVMGSASNRYMDYNSLYQQELTVSTFSWLTNLFKQGTSFRDKTVHIDKISRVSTQQLREADTLLDYKTYRIETRIENRPQTFLAHLGRLKTRNTATGLVFTFQAGKSLSSAPLADLLRGLAQPSTQQD